MIRRIALAALLAGVLGAWLIVGPTGAPATCQPYQTMGAAPYENFTTPPYRTGC